MRSWLKFRVPKRLENPWVGENLVVRGIIWEMGHDITPRLYSEGDGGGYYPYDVHLSLGIHFNFRAYAYSPY